MRGLPASTYRNNDIVVPGFSPVGSDASIRKSHTFDYGYVALSRAEECQENHKIIEIFIFVALRSVKYLYIFSLNGKQ